LFFVEAEGFASVRAADKYRCFRRLEKGAEISRRL
jgi:hypothetical protein